jgi:hypothetical protein
VLGVDADRSTFALDGATLEFVASDEARRGLCAVELSGPSCTPVEIAGVVFSVR